MSETFTAANLLAKKQNGEELLAVELIFLTHYVVENFWEDDAESGISIMAIDADLAAETLQNIEIIKEKLPEVYTWAMDEIGVRLSLQEHSKEMYQLLTSINQQLDEPLSSPLEKRESVMKESIVTLLSKIVKPKYEAITKTED